MPQDYNVGKRCVTFVDEENFKISKVNDKKRKRSLYTEQQLNESPGLDDTPSVRRRSFKRARIDYLDTNNSPKTSKPAIEVRAILSDLVSNRRASLQPKGAGIQGSKIPKLNFNLTSFF